MSCRSPLTFVLLHWRDGIPGAFRVGLHHGLYCVGCRALLLILLLVNGVMSFWRMVLLSVFVPAERLAPRHPWSGRAAGLAQCGWSVWVLAAG